MKAMKLVAAIALLGAALAGCNDFEAGDEILIIVNHDPLNKCRLILTPHIDKFKAMTVTIDGCEQ